MELVSPVTDQAGDAYVSAPAFPKKREKSFLLSVTTVPWGSTLGGTAQLSPSSERQHARSRRAKASGVFRALIRREGGLQ